LEGTSHDQKSVRLAIGVDNIPSCLKDTVSWEIGSESVLWADTPAPWVYARRHWKTALFGIPFTAFAVFWTLGVDGRLENVRSGNHAPPLILLAGLMFIGIGVSMLLSPLLANIKSERVYYVLTDKRAIIFQKVLTTKITSIHRDGLKGFERVSYGGNQGDLVFRRTITGSGRSRREEVIGFLGLDSFQEAEASLWKLLESSNRS
jgi:hypothetical protein